MVFGVSSSKMYAMYISKLHYSLREMRKRKTIDSFKHCCLLLTLIKCVFSPLESLFFNTITFVVVQCIDPLIG
jgi:hypothetical protein